MLQLVVSSPRPLQELTQLADKLIKQPLESVSGVGQIQIVGGAARQIQIRLDPDKMLAHGVTVTDVAAALRQQNLELPGGRMNQGAQEFTVRTMGKIADAQAFNAIPVANRGSYVVRISDIGEAVDAQEELRSASFLNGRPALTLVVSKQSGQNTVAVAQTVKARFAQIASDAAAGHQGRRAQRPVALHRGRRPLARGASDRSAASSRRSSSSSSSPTSARPSSRPSRFPSRSSRPSP